MLLTSMMLPPLLPRARTTNSPSAGGWTSCTSEVCVKYFLRDIASLLLHHAQRQDYGEGCLDFKGTLKDSREVAVDSE
jgi:hypothetical protein